MNSLRALLALAALAAGASHAQEAASTPTAPAAKPDYVSPFARYRAYVEEPVQPWRESNETVRKIGGWQAYGHEAQRDLQTPVRSEAPERPLVPTLPPGDPHDQRGGRP